MRAVQGETGFDWMISLMAINSPAARTRAAAVRLFVGAREHRAQERVDGLPPIEPQHADARWERLNPGIMQPTTPDVHSALIILFSPSHECLMFLEQVAADCDAVRSESRSLAITKALQSKYRIEREQHNAIEQRDQRIAPA